VSGLREHSFHSQFDGQASGRKVKAASVGGLFRFRAKPAMSPFGTKPTCRSGRRMSACWWALSTAYWVGAMPDYRRCLHVGEQYFAWARLGWKIFSQALQVTHGRRVRRFFRLGIPLRGDGFALKGAGKQLR